MQVLGVLSLFEMNFLEIKLIEFLFLFVRFRVQSEYESLCSCVCVTACDYAWEKESDQTDGGKETGLFGQLSQRFSNVTATLEPLKHSPRVR